MTNVNRMKGRRLDHEPSTREVRLVTSCLCCVMNHVVEPGDATVEVRPLPTWLCDILEYQQPLRGLGEVTLKGIGTDQCLTFRVSRETFTLVFASGGEWVKAFTLFYSEVEDQNSLEASRH